jgi:AAA+ superfamily predicted ATPase
MNISSIASLNPTFNISDIQFPDTIKVKPDFSDLGKEFGQLGEETTKNVVTGAMKGAAEATQSPEFYKAMGNIFKGTSQQTTGAFAEAMSDPRLRRQIQEATRAGTKIMGVGAEGFATGLQQEVFPHLEKGFRDFFTSFINVENAIRYGGPMAIAVGIPLATTITLRVLEKRLLNPKPEIIESEAYPKYGRIDRLQRWWSGYKTPEVIFDQEVKNHLMEIEEKTKNIRDHILNGDKEATYTNLLLYGPPGTGKTLFARVLADYTDMDFLPVDGTRLLQSELSFNEIIDMAKRSKYGTIIFIDEADSLFIDRQFLMTSKAPDALSQYKALNHILGLTGQKNNKYMIVAATNNPHVLDEAMDRRFPDTVEMPLPSTSTRAALLNLYIGNQLFNEKNNTKEFIAAAHSLLTPNVIQTIAQQTEGFSPDKLESMIKAIRDSARATKSGIITQSGINDAIKRALKKHQDFIKNKEKRTKAFEQQPEKQ